MKRGHSRTPPFPRPFLAVPFSSPLFLACSGGLGFFIRNVYTACNPATSFRRATELSRSPTDNLIYSRASFARIMPMNIEHNPCLPVRCIVTWLIGSVLFVEACSGIEIAGHPAPMPFRVTRLSDNPIQITGVVQTANGSRGVGVQVALMAALPDNFVPPLGSVSLTETVCDDRGQFEIKTAGIPQLQRKYYWVVAYHPELGMASLRLPDGPSKHELEMVLPPARVLSARVIGPDGASVPGATVKLLRWHHDGQNVSLKNSDRIDAWPKRAMADDDGRFSIHGIPSADSDIQLIFAVSHPAHGDQEIPVTIDGRATGHNELVELRLFPSVTIEGVVVGRDTKHPITGVWLQVVLTDDPQSGDLHFQGKVVFADERGRFRCRVARKERLVIYAYPPTDSGYPAWVHSNRDVPPDEDVRTVQIEVPKGVLVRGKIVERESRRPVFGASLTYWVQRGKRQRHPKISRHDAYMTYWASEERPIATDEDGHFSASVLPGPGYFLVKAPTQDFISMNLTHGEVIGTEPGGYIFCVEAATKINPDFDVNEIETTIELRRGQSVNLTVRSSDGSAVKNALLLDPHYTQMRDTYDSSLRRLPVWNGSAVVRGCDPSSPRRVYVLDVANNEGAVVDLQPEDVEKGQRTVQLARCGCAKLKIDGSDKNPLANQSIKSAGLLLQTYLIDRARPVGPKYDAAEHSQMIISWVMSTLNRSVYRHLKTDQNGVVRLPCLIPGAKYQVIQVSPVYREYKPFTVPEDASESECVAVVQIPETTAER